MTNQTIEEMALKLAPYIQAERRERWERWHDENEEAHRNGHAAPYCIHGVNLGFYTDCRECDNGDDLETYEECPLDIAATTARHMIENRVQDAKRITEILSMRRAFATDGTPIPKIAKDSRYFRWSGVSTQGLLSEMSNINSFMLELV